MMMRKLFAAIVLSATGTAGLMGARGPESKRDTDLLASAAWLAGCWEARAGSRLVEEHWMPPRGNTMLGMGRTMRGDTLVEYEHVRIFERAGQFVYHAMPSGQEPAEFISTKAPDTLLVFENLAHDFPQRVIYRRRGADSLIARVEGLRSGQLRGLDFRYVRKAC